MLQDLASQLRGAPVTVTKSGDIADKVLKANYSLC